MSEGLRMLNDFGVSIAADVVVAAFMLLLSRGERWLERRNPRRRPVLLYGAWAVWLVANSLAYGFADAKALPTAMWAYGILLPTSVMLFWVSRSVIAAFWSVGLRSADRRVEEGIDYKQSLSLVHNELSFLGTGASKLTELTDEFEEALERCRSDRPIRFLLMKPSVVSHYSLDI